MIRTSRKPSMANAVLSMKKIRFRLPSRAVRDVPNGMRIASKNDPISMPSDKLKGASGLVTVLTSICQNESVLTQSGCVGYVVMRHGRKKPTITSAAPRIPIKLTRRRRNMCEMRHPFTNVFQQYLINYAPSNSVRLSRKNWAMSAGSSFCIAICLRSARTTLHCSLAGR